MKKIILLATVLFSSSIFAANLPWSELEQDKEYKVTQDLVFENGVTLPAGDTYELFDIEPLAIPGYPMMYFGFHQKNCTKPDQTADMSIMEVPGNDETAAVGIELEEGCTVGLYLEVKDFDSSSSFEE